MRTLEPKGLQLFKVLFASALIHQFLHPLVRESVVAMSRMKHAIIAIGIFRLSRSGTRPNLELSPRLSVIVLSKWHSGGL